MKNPGTAAVLSAVIPGIGQFYNGDFLRGIFWLIVTPGMWIGTGGLLGWVCHVIAAMTALPGRLSLRRPERASVRHSNHGHSAPLSIHAWTNLPANSWLPGAGSRP